MDIWIATLGEYEDMRVLGVAHSAEAANRLIERAKLSGQFEGYRDYEYSVTGPFTLGEIYDWKGAVV